MDEVNQIREKIDIVAFISEYIPLKKLGRNFKANCPFHNEKSPSFVVSPERQIWHCFGCGKGGDAFAFLMEYENMEFPESLRILAKRTGVELSRSNIQIGVSSQKEKIYEINKAALKFYSFLLMEHKAGTKALAYLTENRQLNINLIKTFDLGYAPLQNSALTDYLITKKKYNPKDLVLAGVSIEIRGRLLDFFRNRIIFPLFDHRGNITGFSGRALNDNDMPKYINTKDTIVYHKGSMFFGLNLAKDEIKLKENVIIVEGEFDMISIFKEGYKNVVAIKGTALTSDQVNLLSRFTPKVTLCLDQDSAGFEATKRSLEVIEKKGLVTNILALNDAKDPDEAIKKDPIQFKKNLKESVNIYDYLIDRLTSVDHLNMENKKKITDTLLPLFSLVSNEIIKEHYLKKLSLKIDISIDSLNKEIDKLKKDKQEEKIIVIEKEKRDRREVLEEYLLALIIQHADPKEVLSLNKKMLSRYKFKTESYQKLIESLDEYFKENNLLNNNKFANYLSAELIKSFDFAYIFPLPKFADVKKHTEEIEKVITELLGYFVKIRLNELTKEISKAEQDKDENKEEDLRKEYSELLPLLKNK